MLQRMIEEMSKERKQALDEVSKEPKNEFQSIIVQPITAEI